MFICFKDSYGVLLLLSGLVLNNQKLAENPL